MPFTNGFTNSKQLQRHFVDHGTEFGAVTAEEYEALADSFLGGQLREGVRECKRQRGDMIRFDPKTDEFGVLSNTLEIRTYFKPVPCVKLKIPHSKKCHGLATNLLYFQVECRKI